MSVPVSFFLAGIAHRNFIDVVVLAVMLTSSSGKIVPRIVSVASARLETLWTFVHLGSLHWPWGN